MSFYRKLASWATKMEEESVKRRSSSKSKRLSYAQFQNSLDGLSGHVGKMIENCGHLLVQHVSTCMNDLTTVMKNVIDDYAGQMQEWLDTTFKLYDSVMSGYFAAHNAAAETRHREADDKAGKRTNHLMNGIIALAKTLGATEINQSQRYLELLERIRISEMENDRKHDILFNTMIALHENVVGEVIKKQRVVTEYRNEPTLEWMVENADELIKFADALKALRDNTIPQDTAMMNAVRSVRGMMQISMHDIVDTLNARTNEWQMAA